MKLSKAVLAVSMSLFVLPLSTYAEIPASANACLLYVGMNSDWAIICDGITVEAGPEEKRSVMHVLSREVGRLAKQGLVLKTCMAGASTRCLFTR